MGSSNWEASREIQERTRGIKRRGEEERGKEREREGAREEALY